MFFACAKAGAILHPISWRLAPAEIAFQLDDAEPAVLLVEDELRPLAEAALALARVRPPFEPSGPPRSSRPPRGGRPAPPHLHERHDGQAEGRAAHPCQLLLDEPLVRPRDRARARRTWCCRCCRSSTSAAGTSSRSSPGGKAPASSSSAASTPRRALELIERERITTMMGVPANYLFMSEEPRFAGRRPLVAAAGRRRRRADAGGAARRLGRARGRDRPGLRAHRGGAERALPAIRGRPPQGRVGRAGRIRMSIAVSRPRASCSFAGRTSSPATGATRTRPPRPSATAGC